MNGLNIVVVGVGFAGVRLATKLRNTSHRVTIIDRNNYHTFQPLLYQVATGSLAPDNIGFPFRKRASRTPNVSFRKAEVRHIDHEAKVVVTDQGPFPYDLLVVATGSKTNFFGDEELGSKVMQLKDIPQALDIRSAFLQAFEDALFRPREEQQGLLHFVVVGGGPTGVEVSGALAEIKHNLLATEYPELDSGLMRITLVEGAPRVLGAFSEASARVAQNYLADLGVEVRVNIRVQKYDGTTLTLSDGSTIATETVVWAAGVKGSPIEGLPAEAYGPNGRIWTTPQLRVRGLRDVFALGDVALVEGVAGGYPMVAPVAIQQAEYFVRFLNAGFPEDFAAFSYRNQGSMATIGRRKAVVEFGRVRFKGWVAWNVWMFVHLMSLVGFKNRLVVLFQWALKYFSHKNIIRLIVRPYHTVRATRS
ncbi:MAG: hypothetical protein RL429_311 [Bacteroidota bacterium]|jgi:NADH dehydrogenase